MLLDLSFCLSLIIYGTINLISAADVDNKLNLLCSNSDDEKSAAYGYISQKCTGTDITFIIY